MNLTERTQLRRLPNRGSHEPETIHEILDAGFLAHVGFIVSGHPSFVPPLYGGAADNLYLHGSAASRLLRHLETGVPACVTVSVVDGLVLARSAFHHSMNYRSVMAFGTARKIDDLAAKTQELPVIAVHLLERRWSDLCVANWTEMKATAVIAFAI